MDYARAVKGSLTDSQVIQEIQEQADLELQRLLTNEELSMLSRKYSLEQLMRNIRKVLSINDVI